MAVNLRRRVKLPDARLRDAILSLQPTAYWPLDDGSGPLRDLIGRYPATVTGSPTYGVAAPSPIGRGVTWSGTGQYAAASASVPTPTSDISVIAAFRTSDATAAERRLSARLAASQFSWRLYLDAGNKLTFNTYQAAGGINTTASSVASCNDNAWHLAIGRFDGTTLTITVDQADASSTVVSGTWHTASTAGVGIAASAAGSTLFPGSMAHVAIINRDIGAAATRWLVSIAKGG